jgi:hypothetical protein
MSKKKQRFFEIAKQISLMSDFPTVKIGCIIVKNKKTIVASGFNKEKTHPKQYRLNKVCKCGTHKQENSFVHAEIDALENGRFRFVNLDDRYEIYLFRQNKNGKLANCRPCASCMSELIKRNITTIHYTTDLNDGSFVTEKILQSNQD